MNNKNVISIVLNNFTNDSRVLKEGVSLQNAGYNVTVIALHENDLLEYEQVQALPIHRVRLKSRAWLKWKSIQILKYLEFVFRVTKLYRNKIDIVHCNDLNTLPIGVLIKKISKRTIKIVYDAHEYETEANGLKGLQKQLSKWLEGFLIRFVDQVITVSDSIANEYVRLYSIPKPHLVLNCPFYQQVEKQDIFRETFEIRNDQQVFLYQGGLSKGRGIELLLEAFSSFNDDSKVLVCMGYGPLEKLVQDKAQQHQTIYFHPAVPPDVLLNYTGSGDYGISFIEDTCLSYRYCLPNKMFEYLMAGLPVLTSNLYEMKRLVETHKIGVVVEENTVESFVMAVQTSLELDCQKVKVNIDKIKKKFCWEEQQKVLWRVYSEL
jgi:glycosyltransferase involved in cell wall biosynthesis